MPFKESLFWIGLTVSGTGLFFLIEGQPRLFWVAVVTTIVGALAVVYSIYTYHHPQVKRLPLWISLLVITWALVGFDYFDRHSGTQFLFNRKADSELVLNKTFRNEKVPLDGYEYRDCTFTDVTFAYNGIPPIKFSHNEMHATGAHPQIFHTDNPAIMSAMEMLQQIGVISSNVPIRELGTGSFVEPPAHK